MQKFGSQRRLRLRSQTGWCPLLIPLRRSWFSQNAGAASICRQRRCYRALTTLVIANCVLIHGILLASLSACCTRLPSLFPLAHCSFPLALLLFRSAPHRILIFHFGSAVAKSCHIPSKQLDPHIVPLETFCSSQNF